MPPAPLLSELRGRLAGETARLSSYRDAQPQLKQFLDQLTRYLGLVGLTALFVGGIGVALSIQAFVREKFQSIAILKALGADSATIIQSYLGQAVGLGIVGSVMGLGMGIALQRLLPQALSTLLATDLLQQVEFSSVLSPAAVGPLAKGHFDLDDYIEYVIEMLHALGLGTHVMAVCHPSVPVFAASLSLR